MKETITSTAERFTESAEAALEKIEKNLADKLHLRKRNPLQRFPILFSLLTTAGVVMTFLGIELLVAGMPWLYEKPLLVLSIGVLLLVGTGSLFKKLG